MRRSSTLLVIVAAVVLPATAGGSSQRVAPGTLLIGFENGQVSTIATGTRRMRALGKGWDPTWSPDGRRIVLSTGGDLFLLEADGSRRRRITRDDLVQHGPVWSPDGRGIAFLQQHPREASLLVPPQDDVVVVDVSTGAARQLTFDRENKSRLAWSPDGKQLTYEINRRPLRVLVAAIDAATGEVRQAESVRPYPIWSPDGRRLAYIATEQEEQSLVVARADGSSPTVLFRGARDTGLSGVAWSPSGRFIVFAYGGWSVSSARLEFVDTVTRRVHPLTSSTGHTDSEPSWSPDSRRIAFARYEPRTHRYAIAVVARTGAGLRVVFRSKHFGRPLWRPRSH